MVANKKRKQKRPGSDGAFFSVDEGVRIRLVDANIADCVHSRFNTRKTRDREKIEELAARIQQNGFERTRSLWGIERDGKYEIFAGGTRLEAARVAELDTVPVFVHEGLSDEQISRKADEDNENDEYHEPVGLLDLWEECHRLHTKEGWSQLKIAETKGVPRQLISNRIKWHKSLVFTVRQAVSDGLFDEGHVEAVFSLVSDVGHFSLWLTTEDAQLELVKEVFRRHVGTTAGVKPTVKGVREVAKRWKALIQTAEDAYESLPEGHWREKFVEILAKDKVRNEAGISQTLNRIVRLRRQAEEKRAAELIAKADEKKQEAHRLKQEEKKLGFLESQSKKICAGDARDLIDKAPSRFNLLLTDPPYGVDYQSNRRVATAKKEKIANDTTEEAFELLTDVLGKAYPRMANHATCLVFTSWRYEPEFRQIIEAAGFTIKGSLIWVKKNHGTGDLAGSFAPKHERIIHAIKGSPKLQRRAPDVLFGQDKPVTDHPNEKPRDLLRQLIEATTGPGDCVVDPFAGSGSTLLEAYRTGRDFFGIELEPRWHQVAIDAVYKMAEQEFADGSLGQ